MKKTKYTRSRLRENIEFAIVLIDSMLHILMFGLDAGRVVEVVHGASATWWCVRGVPACRSIDLSPTPSPDCKNGILTMSSVGANSIIANRFVSGTIRS